MRKIRVSVGICAHNEEKNIGQLIKNILSQKLDNPFQLFELIIVSSGSTDKTDKIIKRWQKKDDRIIPIFQKERLGKANAVNLFIKSSKSKYLVLTSADILIKKGSLALLLKKLRPNKIGLTAAKIEPINQGDDLVSFAVQLQWLLHHKINLQFPDRPKVGELVAFKKIFTRISPTTAVDEANIEPLVHLQGFTVKYVHDAVIYNRGPANLREFLSQRRRIYAGHTALRKDGGYTVVTYSNSRVLGTLLSNLDWSVSGVTKTSLVILLEAIARIFGLLDYYLNLRSHTIWNVTPTTKNLKQPKSLAKLT